MATRTLIFATGNRHKLEEVEKVLDHGRYTLSSLKDIGITEDIAETGSTLEENALIKARYVQSRAEGIVFSEDTGLEVLFEGIVRGRIASQMTGHEGFGYDPIFIPEGYDRSFAELPDEIKLGMSHRTRALSKMMTFLNS